MAVKSKKRYKILFFILPKKSKVETRIEKDKKTYKRGKNWVIAGVLCFIGVVVAVYLRNNHKFVIDMSNKVSEYISIYKKPNMTSPEVRHIGFLKVHKSGGSTVQNVLFRFGLKRNLSFVMPVKSSVYKFSTYGGKPAKLFRTKSGFYDILALHSVYNEREYEQVLPKDAMNIAIIREPLSLMISGAYFHRDIWQVQYLKAVPVDNYIVNLIRYPELYDQNEFSLTKNSMAMDFGFPSGFHVTDKMKIENYLKYLDTKFSLVTILEYFDESMVLLKRELHWHLEDILYIPLNVYNHPTIKDLNISLNDRKKFQDRNFLDVAIYRFFKEKFIKVMTALGSDFQDEVRHFQRVRQEVENHCTSETKRKKPLQIEKSVWNRRFVVSGNDCERMLTSELTFIDMIRALMREKLIGKRRSLGG